MMWIFKEQKSLFTADGFAKNLCIKTHNNTITKSKIG